MDGHGDPDLGFDRVLRIAEEGLDMQMLFDPLEEQLDLPTAAIQLGDGARRQVGIVRQKHQRLALGILDADSTQGRRVVLDCVETGQCANLIANDAAVPLRLPKVEPLKAQVGLGTDDKEAASLVQAMQLLEVDITPIHDVESTCFRHQHVEDIDLVPLAIADVNEAWDVAAQVEQRVHPYRCLGRTEWRPWKYRQTRVGGRGVEVIDRVGQIDTEGLGCIQALSNADQALGEVGVDATARVGQRVSGHRAAKPHVIELGRLSAQSGFDVAGLLVGQLRKGHAQVLVEAVELLDLVLAVVSSNAATKGGQRQVRHDLCKNEFACVHKHTPQSCWKNRKCYERSSNRDQSQTRNNSFPSTCYTTTA